MVTEDAQRSALWLYYAISEHKNEKSESKKINTYETELSGEKISYENCSDILNNQILYIYSLYYTELLNLKRINRSSRKQKHLLHLKGR